MMIGKIAMSIIELYEIVQKHQRKRCFYFEKLKYKRFRIYVLIQNCFSYNLTITHSKEKVYTHYNCWVFFRFLMNSLSIPTDMKEVIF